MRGERGHVPAAELETPHRAPDRARDSSQERRLARAVRSDDGDELALGNLEGDVLESV